MATLDDALYAVIQGPGSADDKIKILGELRKSLPTDRWSTRWVIWGLIFVVIIPIVGLTVSFTWFSLHPEVATATFDVAKLLPQGVVSLASTAIGALAAYITTSHTQTTPAQVTEQQVTAQRAEQQQATDQQATAQRATDQQNRE